MVTNSCVIYVLHLFCLLCVSYHTHCYNIVSDILSSKENNFTEDLQFELKIEKTIRETWEATHIAKRWEENMVDPFAHILQDV